MKAEIDKMVEAVAFSLWIPSLHVEGFPKNDNGTMMNAWQLYEHWVNKCEEERRIYLQHAARGCENNIDKPVKIETSGVKVYTEI